MRTILLKLSGPLQSWGTESKQEIKGTDSHPSKSAIIGMISAALGYTRDRMDDIKELNGLDFGVRVDKKGSVLKDFQMARSFKPKGEVDKPYLTYRYYLEDAVFLVGISSQDEGLLERIYQALQRPYFQLSLGRKSCPINPDYLVGWYDGGVWDALTQTERIISDESTTLVGYFDSHLVDDGFKKARFDRVATDTPSYRKFLPRFETKKVIKKATNNTHDIISFLERM